MFSKAKGKYSTIVTDYSLGKNIMKKIAKTMELLYDDT